MTLITDFQKDQQLLIDSYFESVNLTITTNYKSVCYKGWARLIRPQLIRSSTLFDVSVKCFPIISCLKCVVNSYFYLFQITSN